MVQNYKVYVNNKEVIFENIQKIPSTDNYIKFEQLPRKSKLDQIIHDFERDEDQLTLELLSANPYKLFYLFARSFHPIHAAGGLVRTPDSEILFIFRNGKWDLPKGKMERNETKRGCALREVQEETGLKDMTILRHLPITYHTYTEDGVRILKKTHWFEMLAKKNNELHPQIEEGITEVKWVAENELNMVMCNTYQSIFTLLDTHLNPRK